MKQILILLSILFALFGASTNTSYANLDTIGVSSVIEHCNTLEGGNNILELHFGTLGHYDDVRYYRLPFLNKGTISVRDAYFNSLSNYTIAGCGDTPPSCAINPVGAGSYAAFQGWQTQYAGAAGVRANHNGLNWWPYEHNNDGINDALPWNYTRVTDLAYWCAGSAWESVLCGQYYRNSTTVVRFTPGAKGGVSTNPGCYPASCGSANTSELKSTPLTAGSAGLCTQGAASVFSETTDAAGVTRYSWSCQQAGGNPVSCTNAQYKPLDPTSCNETRLPPQCIYSVKNADKSISTQDGPLTLTLASTTACRAPVDGKPRVVCTASTGTITTSLAGFTLPQAVTQKAGTCQVVFDAPDTCSPRSDTINIIPTTPQCDPQIKDDKNPAYCPRTIVNNTVCVKLADKYGNPVYNYATNTIISILGKVESNSYYGAGDTTVYTPGVFSVVGNEYCIPICVAGTCPPPVSCADTNSCPPPPSNCDPMNKTCAPVTCIKTTTETCTDPVITQPGGGICIQSVANSQCTPPGPVITQPGGGTIITRKKACTGYLEVWNGIEWTNNGDIILYDQPHTYRVVVRDTDPVCQGGSLSINTISELGGGFANSIIYSATGTFTATITKRDTDTPTSLRGIAVQAVFTQPGGITYGLTDLDTDFTDTPIQITGNRMKGVRVIGNTAGTNIGEFNLNNGWVVAEQGPITNAARSTMLQKVALLTRGITSGSLINGILYIEGNTTYSAITNTGFKTLIVRGNLTIDTDISNSGSTDGKGIIVLANSTGAGGNIIIGDGVRFIHALIFAEGTLRGSSTLATTLNQSIQFVLKGSLFSRNTIGGSAVSTALYLAGGAKTTDVNVAFIQDLNNVRNGIEYNLDGSPKNVYKGYSDPFIIDYDPALRLLGLPGFTN